jgi:hypothetical protein
MMGLERSKPGLTPLVKILQATNPFMTQPTKTIHFCPDEWALLLEALHSYKDTNDGRRVAGRLNWVRAKLEDCRAENCLIRLSA